MKYRYPNLSLGYLGKPHKQCTLNSAFYTKLFSSKHPFNGKVNYPQRVPKTGFFEELCELEIVSFRSSFRERVRILVEKMQQICLNPITANSANEFIHYTNLLLRYGQFGEIVRLLLQTKEWSQFRLELDFLRELANINNQLSAGEQLSLEGLYQITQRALNGNGIAHSLYISIMNCFVVSVYRYQQTPKFEKWARGLVDNIKRHLESASYNDFDNVILHSVAYRGIAMCPELGVELQKSFLKRAEQLAHKAIPRTELENLVKMENLLTLSQSLAKWNIAQKDSKIAEAYLMEMLKLDPFDSVPHSELGFFYLKQGRFQIAKGCFKKAVKLGPPSVGMNQYYYAQCLQQLGKQTESLDAYIEAAKMDPLAISPLLDMFKLYVKIGKTKKAKHTCQRIMKNNHLVEQLNNEELLQISKMAGTNGSDFVTL